MQYEASSPAQYLALLENDWRRDMLLRVREMIRHNAPELEEGIKYKMLIYGDVFALNAQKGYVSLYIGTIDKIADARELLKGFDMGKGCIRLKKTSPFDDGRIEKFIQSTAEIWRAGGDVSC